MTAGQWLTAQVLRREMLYCSVDKVLGSFRRYDDIETAELTLQEAMAHPIDPIDPIDPMDPMDPMVQSRSRVGYAVHVPL